MAKYPDQTCRDCGWAEWVWSDKVYPEGRKRIIVQQPGTCTAARSRAGEEPVKVPLDAQNPFTDCSAWVPQDRAALNRTFNGLMKRIEKNPECIPMDASVALGPVPKPSHGNPMRRYEELERLCAESADRLTIADLAQKAGVAWHDKRQAKHYWLGDLVWDLINQHISVNGNTGLAYVKSWLGGGPEDLGAHSTIHPESPASSVNLSRCSESEEVAGSKSGYVALIEILSPGSASSFRLVSGPEEPETLISRFASQASLGVSCRILHSELVADHLKACHLARQRMDAERGPLDNIRTQKRIAILRDVARAIGRVGGTVVRSPEVPVELSKSIRDEKGRADRLPELEAWLDRMDGTRQDMFLRLRDAILGIGPGIEERVRTQTVAFVAGRVFVEFEVSRSRIRLLALDGSEAATDLACERVPDTYRWGMQNQKCFIENPDELDGAIRLAQASYQIAIQLQGGADGHS